MMGRSCIPTHLSQNIQNAQLHKQEDENSGSQNKQQESNLRWGFFAKIVNC